MYKLIQVTVEPRATANNVVMIHAVRSLVDGATLGAIHVDGDFDVTETTKYRLITVAELTEILQYAQAMVAEPVTTNARTVR